MSNIENIKKSQLSNDHIKRFYTEVWNDTWPWLKSVTKFVIYFSVAVLSILLVVYTGISLAELIYGIENLRTVAGGTLIFLGFLPYTIVTLLYFLFKYLNTVWDKTKDGE